MTHRLIIGVDPGQSGAVALLADGVPVEVFDMPTTARKSKGVEVTAAGLLNAIRRAKVAHGDGAFVFAAVEQVGGMPGQGVSSTFHFGESYGIARCALTALHIGYQLVTPQTWKRHHGLINCEKDASRTVVMQKFPTAAHWIERKKDDGRADAILIAAWAHDTEQCGASLALAVAVTAAAQRG
jgi:crossover junction endodeoxyribonuclease RuvC